MLQTQTAFTNTNSNLLFTTSIFLLGRYKIQKHYTGVRLPARLLAKPDGTGTNGDEGMEGVKAAANHQRGL